MAQVSDSFCNSLPWSDTAKGLSTPVPQGLSRHLGDYPWITKFSVLGVAGTPHRAISLLSLAWVPGHAQCALLGGCCVASEDQQGEALTAQAPGLRQDWTSCLELCRPAVVTAGASGPGEGRWLGQEGGEQPVRLEGGLELLSRCTRDLSMWSGPREACIWVPCTMAERGQSLCLPAARGGLTSAA